MIFSTTLVTLTALAASANAGVIRRHNFPVPPTYDAAYLEPYNAYHIRYLALSCYTKHDTTFFDQCCHPLLKSEKLETARPAQCIPSASQSASASAALPTSTILPDGNGGDNGDDEDCEDGDGEPETSPAASSAASTAAPATQPAPVNVEPAPTQEPTTTDHPAQTSSAKPETTETSTAKATSTEKPKPAPTSTANKPASTSGGGGILDALFSAFSVKGSVVQGGIGTWFTQNGNAGNCGTVHQDSDHVIALPTNAYDNGAHCGKKIGIIDMETGTTASGIVADSCPTCINDQSLDLSTSLFNIFANANKGTFKLAYAFID